MPEVKHGKMDAPGRRRFWSRGVLAVSIAAATVAAKPAGPVVSLFNPAKPSVSEWKDSWGEVPAGATAKVQDKKMVVTGTLSNQSFGCVYRPLELDIDKTPYMEIDVEAASHHWYIVFRGEQLPNGYAKVQNDTDQTGPILYDLRTVAGLKGRQSLELQLGISTEGRASGNKGQTLTVGRFQISAAPEGSGDVIQLYGPQNRRLSGWKNVNDDRSPAGVDILPGENFVTLRGNRATQSYGMMYKAMTVDFNRYSVLKFVVDSVTHHWYLILNHPELEQGFARVQPDSNKTGAFYYDLADITGLKGIKNLRLQVGVSTNEQKPSVLGETMTFKEISLLTASQVPAGTKVLKKKDIAFTQPVLPPPPVFIKKLSPPTPAAVAPGSADARQTAADEPVRGLAASLAGEFAARFAASAPSLPQDPAAPAFRETAAEIIVENKLYKISFNKENGAVSSLHLSGSTKPVLTGSVDGSLWRIDTKERVVLESGKHRRDGPLSFKYAWDPQGRLTFDYDDKKTPARVSLAFRFDRGGAVDVEADVKNLSNKTFLSLSLPQGLLFSTGDLKEVVLPRLVGVSFLPGFFRSGRQWSDPYPPAFADFAWIDTRGGSLAVYMVQPEGPFQPATLDIGGHDGGKLGYYNHRLALHMTPGSAWKSPRVRLLLGRAAHAAAQDYARENKLTDFPSLKTKLGEKNFERLNAALTIKMDQSINVDFPTAIQVLDELPSSGLLHLASFWPGGFDKYYPDYLPTNPKFGTFDEFKMLVKKARDRGMLVMPYTNPTWWNEGPTLKKLRKEDIGIRELDGSLAREEYNGNPGWVVYPQHPKVVERNWQTVKEFTQDVPMDLLFHDQMGARRWLYQTNAKEPLSYTQGLIDQTARESRKIPLMTEGGFDRLLPYESGFYGMTSMSYPDFKEYDDLWGEGNWEIHPISLFMAHDKVNFYQHNLSDDVQADTHAKIAWNVAHGFGLTMSRTHIRQNLEKDWIHLGARLHENVLSRVLGRPLEGYLRLDGDATWSRFGDVDVFANHSKDDTLVVGPHALPPGGFLAQSQSGDLTAGFFSRFNGAALDAPAYLIVKATGSALEVLRPGRQTAFVTLERPAAWGTEGVVRAWQDKGGKKTEIPVAADESGLTLLLRGDEKADGYVVRHEAGGDDVQVSLRLSAAALSGPRDIEAEVIVKNPGTKAVSDVKVHLSAWKIGPRNSLPGLDAGGTGGKAASAAIRELEPGRQESARFAVRVPASFFFDGRYVWVRARVESKSRGRAVVRTVDRKVDLSR